MCQLACTSTPVAGSTPFTTTDVLPAFRAKSQTFTSYHGGGGLNVAMTRRLSLFTDYSIYRYDVPAGATVFTSLSKFSRHSVTAGLSVWAPLISERSARDTR